MISKNTYRTAALALFSAAAIFLGAGAAEAASANVFKVAFSYTCAALCGPGGTVVQGANVAIATTNGADGITFYPTNAANLLVAGQTQNNVAQITTSGMLVVNVKADSTNADPQAFALAVTPDNANLLALPNLAGAGANSIDVLPLGATMVAAGTSKTVSGPDTALRGVAFCGAGLCNGNAYYVNANDNGLGDFGLLSTPLTTPTTSLVTVTNSGCATPNGQGCLPSDGIVWDPFSSSFIIVSKNQVWQLQQTGASTWNVVSKFFSANTNDVFDNPWVDGNGHLFVSDAANGNILFIDYTSSAHLIGSASNFVYEHFLAAGLEGIAVTPIAPSGAFTLFFTVPPPNTPPTITAASGVTRQQGAASSNSQIATVVDTQDPPTALTVTVNGGTSATVNDVTVSNIAVDNSGNVTADVVASCSASNASFTLRVTDSGGLFAEATLNVSVTASNPPVITLNPATVLGPPNHSYHTFTISDMVQSATDDCNGNVINNIVIEKATSDEAENGPNTGNTLNDIVIASDCQSVQLRAERDGAGDGRVYLVTLRVSDSSGNITRAVYQVSVPVGKNPVVNSGVHYTVLSNCQP